MNLHFTVENVTKELVAVKEFQNGIHLQKRSKATFQGTLAVFFFFVLFTFLFFFFLYFFFLFIFYARVTVSV